MNEAMERAQREFGAAQKKLEALSKVPEHDTFPAGTVLKWKPAHLSQPYVALKSSGLWWISGTERGRNWPTLVSAFLTHPLDYLLKSIDWSDASVQPPEIVTAPPFTAEATDHRWTLTHENGVQWVLHGMTWERVKP